MRYALLAVGFSLAVVPAVSASAEMGGPLTNENGRCRQFNSNRQGETFYYWVDPPCVSTEERRGGVGRRLIRSTANAAEATEKDSY
jgi:hypothetical protein